MQLNRNGQQSDKLVLGVLESKKRAIVGSVKRNKAIAKVVVL